MINLPIREVSLLAVLGMHPTRGNYNRIKSSLGVHANRIALYLVGENPVKSSKRAAAGAKGIQKWVEGNKKS